MIRILSVDSANFSGVAFWRNLRPLTELQRNYPDIQVVFSTEDVTVSNLMAADVLIMYRPVTEHSMNLIEGFKRMGPNKRVIIDIDDNLWRLPPGHPSEADYAEAADHMNQLYALADGVWCSTEPLTYFADARDGRGRIVPNAILESDLPKRPTPYKGFVCWRGGIEQSADICSPEAISAFEENKDKFKGWFFWGWQPGQYRARNVRLKKRVDPLMYMSSLAGAGINVMWKPLQENEFNDSKSNIAFIEATMAGAICVTNYAHKPGWELAVDKFTDNPDFIASQWAASRAWILEHYELNKINAIRYHHIRQLMGFEGETIRV